MSMSTHVVGFMPPTEEYKKKAEAWRACKAADVPIPNELRQFFRHGSPDDAGMTVALADAVREWDDGDTRSGYEVDISKLPPGVTVVRFYNSW